MQPVVSRCVTRARAPARPPTWPPSTHRMMLAVADACVRSASDTRITVDGCDCINLASLGPMNFQNNAEVKVWRRFAAPPPPLQLCLTLGGATL